MPEQRRPYRRPAIIPRWPSSFLRLVYAGLTMGAELNDKQYGAWREERKQLIADLEDAENTIARFDAGTEG